MPESAATIIVVNDNEILLEMLVAWLREAQFEPVPFQKTKDVIDRIVSHGAPSLIVTDLNMPDIDGWRLCRLLRSPDFQQTNMVPIILTPSIFYSGLAAKDVIQSLNIDGYLPLPCGQVEFIEMVGFLLKRKAPLVRRSLLLIEDDELLRRAFRAGLESKGFEVFEAGTAAEGLAKARAESPDVIVLDHRLPDQSGLDILPQIRQANPAGIVVVATAFSSPELAVRYTSAGVDGFLRKPFELSRLVDAINTAKNEQAVVQIEDILAARTKILRENEEHFRDLYDNAPLGYHTCDRNGRILSINKTELRWLGYTAGELIGRKTVMEIQTPASAALLARHLQDLQTRRSTTWDELELEMVRKDGAILPVRIHGLAVYDRNGILVSTRTIVRDITDLKRAHERQASLQERLVRAERMEALGILAGGVAHDLNNIMGPLVGLPDLILEDLDAFGVPEDHHLREDLVSVSASAKRAAAIIRDLLVLGRRGGYQPHPVSVNKVITDYVKSADYHGLQQRFPRVSVRTRLDEALPAIQGSEPHLTQVIMNLVSNAFEAMPQGGTLSVETLAQRLEEPLVGYDLVDPGTYAVLRVADTGSGIEPDIIGKIFEPFFTRKKMEYSGSGLGLSIVYGVVKDFGGCIDVRSRVGQGTAFSLFFPIAVDRAGVPGEDAGNGGLARGSESVLVVDDDEDQRRLLTRLLKRLGYEVTAVESGRAAVQYLRGQAADLVVLDMIMEEDFDGLVTYREILQVKPDQKCIISSGYSETERVKEAIRLGARRYIQKPYSVHDLSRAVREVLEAT